MKLINIEQRFRDLFENTSDLIHFLNTEGIIQLVNHAWLNTLGYTFDEVKGTSIYNYIHPDCRDKYHSYRERIIAERKTWEIETTFITKAGNKVNIEGHISCHYENGIPVYTRGIFRNITERKEAEAHLKAIFTSAPDAVIVINQQSTILKWNAKAETLFGFSAKEVTGKNLTEYIIPERYRESHQLGMQYFLKTGEGPVLGRTIEITALNKAGKEFFINLSISAAKITDNWYFIAFASDITQRKLTEEALIKKEAELFNSRIQDQKKEEFISIASHELKTPLTSIKAYVELIGHVLDGNANPDTGWYIQKASEGIHKLENLISELLDISRIQAGKLPMNLTTFNFNDLVDSCIESASHISPLHKIHKKGNADFDINGDKERLEQVLMNYLTNAIKYSPNNDRIIVNVVREGDEIKVGVTDFGIGIPNDKKEKVFERFYRVENIHHSVQGLGIGLYISSEIIKRHHGRVWVESEEDKGSTFYFALPLGALNYETSNS